MKIKYLLFISVSVVKKVSKISIFNLKIILSLSPQNSNFISTILAEIKSSNLKFFNRTF